uniref:Putative secreted protein n=1 Tax=Anopheles darlingi TaxID=43151 RepID=A0A2M4DQT6_ANODA
MKHSVKLILLAVLFCAYCTNAQEDDVTDPDTDADPTVALDGTNQLDTKRAGRITGGTIASIGDYPYIAAILITNGANSIESFIGVIINDNQVLTSAHTVDPNRLPGGIKSVSEGNEAKKRGNN